MKKINDCRYNSRGHICKISFSLQLTNGPNKLLCLSLAILSAACNVTVYLIGSIPKLQRKLIVVKTNEFCVKFAHFFRFYILAIIFLPILFYIPKFFEVRSHAVTIKHQVRRQHTQHNDIQQGTLKGGVSLYH